MFGQSLPKWSKRRNMDRATQSNAARQLGDRFIARPSTTRSDEGSREQKEKLSKKQEIATREAEDDAPAAGPSGSNVEHASEGGPQPHHIGAASDGERKGLAIATPDANFVEGYAAEADLLKGDAYGMVEEEEVPVAESSGAAAKGREEGTGAVATGEEHPRELEIGVENEGEPSAEFREIGERLETDGVQSPPN